MADLEELIERVESGTGADYDLNCLIFAKLYGWSHPLIGSAATDFTVRGGFYTTSLDAVLALIEAKLPGAAYVLNSFDVQRTPTVVRAVKAHVSDIGGGGFLGSASSPARALLAATLRALKETQHVAG